MEVVVTEELRGRGNVGRELVESEEAVEIVEAFERAVSVSKTTADAAPPPRRFQDALAEALASPDVVPGPHTTALIRQQAERARVLANQPDAKEFLGRPYHAFNRSRFLFSCADEPDGCAQNRATAWQYTLPEGPGGSSSTDTGR